MADTETKEVVSFMELTSNELEELEIFNAVGKKTIELLATSDLPHKQAK